MQYKPRQRFIQRMKPIEQIIAGLREGGEDLIRVTQMAERGMQASDGTNATIKRLEKELKDQIEFTTIVARERDSRDEKIKELKSELSRVHCELHSLLIQMKSIVTPKLVTQCGNTTMNEMKSENDALRFAQEHLAPADKSADEIKRLETIIAHYRRDHLDMQSEVTKSRGIIKDLERCLAESGTADPMLLATTQDALKCRTEELNIAKNTIGNMERDLASLQPNLSKLQMEFHEVSAQRDYWKEKHAEVEKNYATYREYWKRAAPMMAKAADDFSKPMTLEQHEAQTDFGRTGKKGM